MTRASAYFTEALRYQCYCSLRSQQLGQNPFQITFGDGIIYLYETIKRKIRGINHGSIFRSP